MYASGYAIIFSLLAIAISDYALCRPHFQIWPLIVSAKEREQVSFTISVEHFQPAASSHLHLHLRVTSNLVAWPAIFPGTDALGDI